MLQSLTRTTLKNKALLSSCSLLQRTNKIQPSFNIQRNFSRSFYRAQQEEKKEENKQQEKQSSEEGKQQENTGKRKSYFKRLLSPANLIFPAVFGIVIYNFAAYDVRQKKREVELDSK